ncbi:MAG: AIR synthase related protein, partial [Candidatus Heimdallarchaeota archaeon]
MVEGKVTLENLSFLLSRLGIKNPGIIVPPLIGSDATAFDFDMAKQVALDYYGLQEECYMVWKSDPITFPAPDLSKYSIIVNLNDLTCFGAIPYGILVTLLLPTHFNQSDLQNFQNSLHETALDYNISILGGHSEFTSAVIRPVIDLSMIGFVPKTFLPTRNLAAGDHVYLLGYVGNEGTAILGEK